MIPSIRITLTDEQSQTLQAAGIRFAIVHPGSYPINPAGYHLDLIACDYQQAAAALSVATGEARATRPRVKIPETT